MEEINMAKYETWEILQMIEEEDVKFIRLQFVDIFGTIRNIAVTAGQMEESACGEMYGGRIQHCRDERAWI